MCEEAAQAVREAYPAQDVQFLDNGKAKEVKIYKITKSLCKKIITKACECPTVPTIYLRDTPFKIDNVTVTVVNPKRYAWLRRLLTSETNKGTTKRSSSKNKEQPPPVYDEYEDEDSLPQSQEDQNRRGNPPPNRSDSRSKGRSNELQPMRSRSASHDVSDRADQAEIISSKSTLEPGIANDNDKTSDQPQKTSSSSSPERLPVFDDGDDDDEHQGGTGLINFDDFGNRESSHHNVFEEVNLEKNEQTQTDDFYPAIMTAFDRGNDYRPRDQDHYAEGENPFHQHSLGNGSSGHIHEDDQTDARQRHFVQYGTRSRRPDDTDPGNGGFYTGSSFKL